MRTTPAPTGTKLDQRIPSREDGTLYLCKMDPDAAGGPRFIAALGTIERSAAGYRFFPNASGRVPSRKFHPTLLACIPAWAEKHDYLELLDYAEMLAAQRKSALS